MTKKRAEILLADVPEDKRFWCADGRVLKNLTELESALNDITTETFQHHSNEEKSDFANWVRDVIGDTKLARDLSKGSDAAQASGNIRERIAWLREKLGKTT